MTNNDRNQRSGHQDSTTKEKGQGSGQQTAGVRGQKQNKENKEHYRSSEQKKQKGNHGGNR